MIFNFFNFILESSRIQVPIKFSVSLISIFQNSSIFLGSPISADLLALKDTKGDISLLNVDGLDTISFTTSAKLSQHFSVFDESILSTYIYPLSSNSAEIYHKNRYSIKIGRLINKLFGNKYNSSEIEKFVNIYKSIMRKSLLVFEVWSDINKGYSSSLYTQDARDANALLNSCMNDELAIITFYTYVPVKLLVLLNSEGHIFGRALIWETNRGLFMDRIYTAFDCDYYKFIEYARENKIIYKDKNKSGPNIEYVKDGITSWFEMSISLKFDIVEYSYDDAFFSGEAPKDIPYMDTFIYGFDRTLTNKEPSFDKFYILQDTEGIVALARHNYDIDGIRILNIDEYRFSDVLGVWINHIDAIWVDEVSDFFTLDYLQDLKNGFIFDKKWIVKRLSHR